MPHALASACSALLSSRLRKAPQCWRSVSMAPLVLGDGAVRAGRAPCCMRALYMQCHHVCLRARALGRQARSGRCGHAAARTPWAWRAPCAWLSRVAARRSWCAQEAEGNDISSELKFAALHDCETKWKTCGNKGSAHSHMCVAPAARHSPPPVSCSSGAPLCARGRVCAQCANLRWHPPLQGGQLWHPHRRLIRWPPRATQQLQFGFWPGRGKLQKAGGRGVAQSAMSHWATCLAAC
jgi:hypothetical protein